MSLRVDAVVIGGGLAGIAAATRLSRAHRSVALIEARPRFGGRVRTLHDPDLDHAIELGPEWFDAHGTIHRVLAGTHRRMQAARGGHWRRIDVDWLDVNAVADGGSAIHKRLSGIGGRDRSLRRALNVCCRESALASARDMMLRYVEGFHAADPDQLSLRWFLEAERNQSAGTSDYRTADGLDVAVDGLLREIGPTGTVFLDTSVQRVEWSRGAAIVEATSRRGRGSFAAPAVVVTVPISLLQLPDDAPGSIRFSPPLTAKRDAFRRIAMGPVHKFVLICDVAWWRDLPRIGDALFVQDFRQPIPTWWTARPCDAPVLTGWVAGPAVGRSGVDWRRRASIKRMVIASVAAAFDVGVERVTKHLRRIVHHDWLDDPRSQGAYSWPRVGGAMAHAQLAEPLARSLYFAGEATAGGGMNATMDGAYQSGWRAAGELLDDHR